MTINKQSNNKNQFFSFLSSMYQCASANISTARIGIGDNIRFTEVLEIEFQFIILRFINVSQRIRCQ